MEESRLRCDARRFSARFLIGAAVACSALAGFGAEARAEDFPSETEVQTARRQYREGISLEAAGDWALALKKFEAVARVKLTPQVRFHIARNKENLGRLTEALGDYRLAEYDAKDVNEEELRKIREAREALESRIPRLQVTTDSSAAGATITLDGVEVGRDRLAEALPVDPGSHRVMVRFQDGTVSEYLVHLVEGHTEALTIRGPDPDPQPQPPPPQVAPGVPEPSASRAWWPWVAAGAGAAGLVSGGVLFYLRADAINSLEENCSPAGICREEYRTTYENGQTYATFAPLAFGVGLVGVGAAILGFVLETDAGDPEQEPALDLAVGPEQLGVAVRGDF